MSKSLYRVKFISQVSGEEVTHYVLANSMNEIEDNYADIEAIKPLPMEEL